MKQKLRKLETTNKILSLERGNRDDEYKMVVEFKTPWRRQVEAWER